MTDLGAPLLPYAESPPPSYDDVVNTPQRAVNSKPSAPPPEEIAHGPILPVARPGYDDHQSSERERNVQQTAAKRSSSKVNKAIEAYVSFSTAHLLRMNIEPPPDGHEDPELDVEAQFSQRAGHSAQQSTVNNKCLSGWCWCIGGLQVLLYFALPVVMIVTGVFGFNSCPFRSRTIIIYLFLGGSVLALTVLLRVLPSISTCCRNRNFLQTKDSTKCVGSICACETLFCLVFLLNIAALALGTYWVFATTPPPSSCGISNEGCNNFCSTNVYVPSAVYIVLQYILYLFSALYLCLVLICHRCLKNKMH